MKKEPKLRFKEFKGEWEEKRLGEVVTFGNGKDYKHLKIGNYPVYGTGGYMLSVDDYLYDGDSVCIGRKGSINKPMFISGKFWTVDTLFYIYKFINSIPKFIYLLCQKINWLIHNEASGVPSLSKSTIEKIKIHLPQLPEQTKIANFLTSIDSKIELLTKKEALLQEYKKGVMQKIFNQEIRFKADDGSEFEKWEEKRLGDFIKQKVINNKDKLSNLVLSVNNKKGFIAQDEQFNGYEIASQDLSKYKIVKKNDYAYNPSRINVGSIARLQNFNIGIVSPMYIVFVLNCIDYVFFDNLIKIHRIKHLIKIGCSGSVRNSLGFDDLCNFKIHLPQLPEQTKIANFLSSIDSKIEFLQKQLSLTKDFKKSLLQQMFV